ncbi:MAG TPA: hypothetical protein VFK89_10030 [Actinomycetota bacterium]|nr:hypothetical protein [Actinomycetota bacterium]
MSQYAAEATIAGKQEATLDRKAWDTIISGAGAVIAAVLLVVGILAVVGGNFAYSNVKDRLAPEKVTFPPITAMTPEEKSEVGDFAGARVDTGPEAEAFSRYIAGHLMEVNEGKTYSETSAAAREEGLDPKVAAELQGKADVLFKGETLRAILLNAYGWWTVGTITLYAGYASIVGGLLLGLFAFFGFRHARRSAKA